MSFVALLEKNVGIFLSVSYKKTLIVSATEN